MKNFVTILLVFTCTSIYLKAQNAKQLSSSEIYEQLEKFNFLGSVLYLAAHPDDENTRLISYVSKGLHARTAYLSLTRGDGGQNLIGTEIRELLGVLRSQELQMARATDGGQQFFTRANDFGYSKHPDETLKIWNKDEILADVVYTIRQFKPDIIINRFDHRTPGKSHGHHTSSAMLSVEAFDLTNNNSIYPEQLSEVEPWQVKRQFMNTSWWFYGSKENFAKADKTNMIGLDVGVFFPTLGVSNNEIAAIARSKHRSQGFGSAGKRGSHQEYLELINGDMPKNKENLFEGINTTWTRVQGGDKISQMTSEVLMDYDFKDPSKSVDQLLAIYQQVSKLDDNHWKEIKLKDLTEIILQCSGLFAEATVETQQATRGDSIEVIIELTNRSNKPFELKSASINNQNIAAAGPLESYTEQKYYHDLAIASDASFSNPLWLNNKGTLGTYKIEEPTDRNKPQSAAPFNVVFNFQLGDVAMQVKREVVYKYVDPAVGEIRQPFVIIPAATISFDKDMYLFAQEKSQTVEVKVRAGKDQFQGKLKLLSPKGWQVEPAFIEVDLANKGLEQSYVFKLTSPNNISEGTLKATIDSKAGILDKTLINIDYSHIPLQTVLLPAQSKIVKVPLKTGGRNIGYVMGAGDKMPECLESVGYNITELSPNKLANLALEQFDAIVVGIRAYNKVKNLKLYNQYLWDYAKQGGTVVVQYNTSRRLNFEDLAPYPIKLSRKRVTDEFAEMRITNKDHQALHHPNKIDKKDFDGWAQERGLYFAEEWDDQYKTLFSCNDLGEEPLEGSTLIAEHGKGYFVYSSISWFRQLPAGVPGAYRIFANLLALSSDDNHEKP